MDSIVKLSKLAHLSSLAVKVGAKSSPSGPSVDSLSSWKSPAEKGFLARKTGYETINGLATKWQWGEMTSTDYDAAALWLFTHSGVFCKTRRHVLMTGGEDKDWPARKRRKSQKVFWVYSLKVCLRLILTIIKKKRKIVCLICSEIQFETIKNIYGKSSIQTMILTEISEV